MALLLSVNESHRTFSISELDSEEEEAGGQRHQQEEKATGELEGGRRTTVCTKLRGGLKCTSIIVVIL